MAQQKRKPKVKKAHAAKKKARVVKHLKRHVPKARPAAKKLARAKVPAHGKKPVPVKARARRKTGRRRQGRRQAAAQGPDQDQRQAGA